MNFPILSLFKLPALKSFSLRTVVFGATTCCLFISAAHAQLIISETGTALTENFDSLGTSATATLPEFWRVDNPGHHSSEGAPLVRTLGTYVHAGTATTHRAGNNLSGNNSGIYNFGAGDEATAEDRALGFRGNSNGTHSGNIYAQFKNETGVSISTFSIAYDVEQYLGGTRPQGYRFQLYYSLDGENWTDAGSEFYNFFAASTENGGFDPAPGETQSVNSELTFSTPIANGELFYLAWNFSVASGETLTNGQALGVDNFSISAIPEPSTAFILLGGVTWVATLARKK